MGAGSQRIQEEKTNICMVYFVFKRIKTFS